MIKREELSNPTLAWIKERMRLGKNRPGDAQLMEASECAINMAMSRNGQEPKRKHRRKTQTEAQ
jgi:hypothetical protein